MVCLTGLPIQSNSLRLSPYFLPYHLIEASVSDRIMNGMPYSLRVILSSFITAPVVELGSFLTIKNLEKYSINTR